MRRASRTTAERYQRSYGELELLAGNTAGEMRTRAVDLKFIHIRPGESTSLHRHLVAESIFYVVEGRSSYDDGVGKQIVLQIGDTIIVDAGEPHRFNNVGNVPVVLLEVESPPHDSTDKYILDKTYELARCDRNPGRFWQDPSRVSVKVCGITNLDAAVLCFDLGVDAIGVHLVGPRRMEMARAWSRWLSAVPAEMSVFILTDASDPRELLDLASRSNADTVQQQGPLSLDVVRRCADAARTGGWRFVKSIGIRDDRKVDTVDYVVSVAPHCDGILIDSAFRGGTGIENDWNSARRIANLLKVPVILAGGLNSCNVQSAIDIVQPLGIDVESGVEKRFGVDRGVSARTYSRLDAFMAAVGRRQSSGG